MRTVKPKLQVWAIKINPKLVELRSTLGPLQILVSKSCKGKVKIPFQRYVPYKGNVKYFKEKVITLRHTQAMNGEVLDIVELQPLMVAFPFLTFRNDVAKVVDPGVIELIMRKGWRNQHLWGT